MHHRRHYRPAVLFLKVSCHIDHPTRITSLRMAFVLILVPCPFIRFGIGGFITIINRLRRQALREETGDALNYLMCVCLSNVSPPVDLNS
jgi:hypothetical protein